MKKLEEIAKKALKENKNLTEVFVTSDGYPFETKNAAELHASSNANKKKLQVYRFENKPNKESKPAKLSAEERVEKVSAMETVAEIEGYLKDERAKTVLAAGKARKEHIEAIAGNPNSPESRGNTLETDSEDNPPKKTNSKEEE